MKKSKKMFKICDYLKQFITRVKYKGLERHEQFIISFIFTYLLSIVFSVLIIFQGFEDRMVTMSFKEGLLQFIRTTETEYTFGNCNGLDAVMYIMAKLFETLIPTTLTFSGLIFVTQNGRGKHNFLNAFLAIVLFIFAMVGMSFMLIKIEAMLNFYMYVLMFLFIVAILLSAKMFSLENVEISSHKNEPSDGKICG